MNAQKLNNITLLLSDARGVFIPQDFVEEFEWQKWGIDEADAEILAIGPANEWYWETWDIVLNSAQYEEDGKIWSLHQDGDLFAVAWDELTDDEYEEFMGEPRDDKLEEHEMIAVAYLMEYGGLSWREAKENREEPTVFEGALLEVATEIFDETHNIPNDLAPYIDYAAFASDCQLEGSLFEFEYKRKTYTIQSNY